MGIGCCRDDRSESRKALSTNSYPGHRPTPSLSSRGDSAYIHSVLLCVSNIPQVVDYFMGFSNSHYTPISQDRTIGTIFADFVKIRVGEAEIVGKTDDLIEELGKLHPVLRENKRQDAYHFLDTFLGLLSAELGMQSYFVKQFRGLITSRVECMNCGNSQSTEDHFLTVSLTVPEHGVATLHECLQAFTARENLHNANLWNCEECQFYVSSSRELHFKFLPSILLIHLKRFITGDSSRKVKTLVEYPITDLDMSQYVPLAVDSSLYRLTATVRHKGKGLPGRYIATMLNLTTQEWFEYDDGRFTRVQDTKILSADAYLLVYSRVDPEER